MYEIDMKDDSFSFVPVLSSELRYAVNFALEYDVKLSEARVADDV